MKKAVKWIFVVVIVLLIAVMGIFSMLQPMTAELSEVKSKKAEMYFTHQGEVVAQRVVEVYSVVSGAITTLNVWEGQKVNAGDVICTVDSSGLLLEIAQIESNIKGYEAQKGNLSTQEVKEKDSLISKKDELKSQIKALEEQAKTSSISKEEQIRLQKEVILQNENNLKWSEENLQKVKMLYEGGVFSEKDYNNSLKELEDAQATLEQSNKQLNLIQNTNEKGSEDYYAAMREALNVQIAGVDRALSKNYTGSMAQYYDSLAQGGRASIELLYKKIEDCKIKSPISGVIKNLHIKDTNVASVSSPIATITGEGHENIEVFVSTSDIDEVFEGQAVELILKRREGDKTYTGKVIKIEDEAVEKISALGVEEKSVKVTIEPDDKTIFKSGYDVLVKFIFYAEENKLTVPKTALFKVDDEKYMVWVVRNGIANTVEVEKGVELQTETVIESGINEGDFVIKDANIAGLKEGVKIKSE